MVEARSGDRPVWIFQHLPKTAGTSLGWLVVRCFDPARVYEIREEPRAEAAAFAALQPERRDRYDLLTGHMMFGAHRHLGRPARYLTMLRDPVQRAISDLVHRAKAWREPIPTPVSLGEALAGEGDPRFATQDNLYTRWLAGPTGAFETYRDGGGPGAEDFERARRRMDEHFAFVGVTERFTESAAVLEALLDVTFAGTVRMNAAVERPPLRAIDPAALEAFRKRNAFDEALYRQAGVRLDAALRKGGTRLRLQMMRLRAGAVLPVALHAAGYVRRRGVRDSVRRALVGLRGDR